MLVNEGLAEFIRIKWGLAHKQCQLFSGEGELPMIESSFFLNKRGAIRHPPTLPYMSVRFVHTPAQSLSSINGQWLESAGLLAQEMSSRGTANAISLPPEITDVRPWQWAGYRAYVKYTLYLDFPYSIKQANESVRRNIRKAEKLGYRCVRTLDAEAAFQCLAETQERKGLTRYLTASDLQLAVRLIGDEGCRVYVCYAPNGEPASASIILLHPGERAKFWLVGTVTSHLQAGVTQLLIRTLLEDLQEEQVLGFDFVGANNPGVADSKIRWGARLVPYYVLNRYGVKPLLHYLREWWLFAKTPGRG
ncbi:GNAT family N-acetyltransferase [Brevibacillus ruminantium]|uniref:GNAT family N-acetyltransferase n=1 Tax=Brevibacillus ruminantium TaxID=2950604 RepID=A0ABY4WJU7_9BACL|nr:GNAT family N-acetyltransferase [Brevibacillus ruminantium]USG67134.1 GNAT family N-acetyltransferase [Brevibacillus ruminantium]